VRRHLEIFESMGFGVSALDADAFMVDALPDILGEVACQPLLIDVAKSLEEAGPRRGRTHWREEAIARAAALAAVPPFANLTAQELTQLIRDLSACGMPYLCPRGQPTMVFNSFRDIARRFGHA
jgi:DNA mismatch repair protein MutL